MNVGLIESTGQVRARSGALQRFNTTAEGIGEMPSYLQLDALGLVFLLGPLD